jgi:hypothetical protein
VSLSFSGNQGTATTARTTDAYGFLYIFLGDGWNPGVYTLTANWPGGFASGTGTKPQ